MSDMDGKKKLEELVAGLDGVTPGPWSPFIDDSGDEWTGWPLSISADSITDKTVVRPGGFYPYRWDTKTSQHEAVANAAHIARCDPDTIRSISDAYKALEAENERLRALIAAGDDAHRSIVSERATPHAMKDVLIEHALVAWFGRADWRDGLSNDWIAECQSKANAVLAIARPAIRKEAMEEAVAHLTVLSNAMWEKADHVSSEGFEPPTAEERDSAVMAYDLQKAAECVCARRGKEMADLVGIIACAAVLIAAVISRSAYARSLSTSGENRP